MAEQQEPFGYTIYRNPTDQPGMYVMRGWYIEGGTVQHVPEGVATPINDIALETLRHTLRSLGKHCIGRQSGDDPAILEVWI